MSSEPTRREFLQGKAAADALVDRLPISHDASPTTISPPAESYTLQVARRAMACQFEFLFNAGQYSLATEAAMAALDLVDQLDDQLTVYRDHSEISRLNALAADELVIVEPRLFALLQLAVQLHRQTQGAYDVTSAVLSNLWGFTRRRGTLPHEQALREARALVGSDQLLLDEQSHGVRFAKSGLAINLGSIGKGYALDRCAELIESGQIHDFVLHGGHSSVLARGSRVGEGPEGGWWIGIRHPLRPDRRLAQIRLHNRALATSGSGTQFFMHEGRRYGHILDPRTGWPAEGVLSASVIAPTAAEADALATAFYVMGPRRTREYCQLRPEIGAVLLCPGERHGSLEQHLIGISEGQWRELAEPTS
jgi:thiamine biosynthesis lipoprotein